MVDSSTVANPLAPKTEEDHDPHFEPVIKLTEEVETKTNEEDETVIFKLRAKLFRFDSEGKEWKERGTGEARLLQHKETQKIRLVMRREKTLKVCANHLISADMKLQPNIGSDRSWVWKVAADYSEDPPTSETLAIRFANPELAGQFKTAFENARESNTIPANAGDVAVAPVAEGKPEETAEPKGEGEANAPTAVETNPPATGSEEKTGGE
ncbi:putative YRB1-ran-specific GTPase-activating protein [Multifurca ochricompacta]|uniref:YRB1-ran-specific GTPase-activating protein n=1 Tax=Multifurca ochricompacta TaxID=376703 RepID=A0AAD4QPI3_9AGAM|nr:putative YRB1-ran-specific GTPase-activating protein [Multifurca ochricompacta]